MDKLNIILQIVSALIGIFVTAVGFIIPLVKNVKAKNVLQTAVSIAEKVQPYIVEAEEFINYTGEEKKAYVLTKANQYAIENNLSFDVEAVSKEIDNLVELTKQVNQREKDKATTETTQTA